MVDRVKTRVELEGAEQYAERAQRATRSIKDLSDESRTSASSVDTIRDAFNRASAALGPIAAGAAAATVAIAGVARGLETLARHGGDVSDVAQAFERLASPQLLGRLREGTAGLVSDMRLMREATQSLRAGLVSESEIARWYRAVTVGAQDVGQSVDAMMASVADMLAGGRMTALRELGVSVAGIAEEVQAAGLEMDSTAGRGMALDIALDRLERRTGGAAATMSNMGDALDAIANSAESAFDQFARGFSETDELTRALSALNVQLRDGRVDWQTYGTALGEAITSGLTHLARLAQDFFEFNASIQQFAMGLGVRLPSHVTAGTQRGIDWARSIREGLTAPPPIPGGEAAMIAEGATPAGRRFTTLGTGRPITARRGGGRREERPAGSFGSSLADDLEAVAAAYAERREALKEMEDEELARIREIERAEKDRLETLKGTEEEHHQRRMSMLEDEATRWRELKEEQDADERARWDRASQGIGQLGEAVGLIGEIFSEIADAQDEETKKADAWRKVVGVAKGTFYAVEAVAAAAEGIKQGASQNYAGMALGLVAAAKYGVASGYMFSRVAQSGGGGGGASATAGTFTPSTPSRISQRGTGERGTERVVVLGLGTSDAGVAASLLHANRALVRSGRTPVAPTGVRYYG